MSFINIIVCTQRKGIEYNLEFCYKGAAGVDKTGNIDVDTLVHQKEDKKGPFGLTMIQIHHSKVIAQIIFQRKVGEPWYPVGIKALALTISEDEQFKDFVITKITPIVNDRTLAQIEVYARKSKTDIEANPTTGSNIEYCYIDSSGIKQQRSINMPFFFHFGWEQLIKGPKGAALGVIFHNELIDLISPHMTKEDREKEFKDFEITAVLPGVSKDHKEAIISSPPAPPKTAPATPASTPKKAVAPTTSTPPKTVATTSIPNDPAKTTPNKTTPVTPAAQTNSALSKPTNSAPENTKIESPAHSNDSSTSPGFFGKHKWKLVIITVIVAGVLSYFVIDFIKKNKAEKELLNTEDHTKLKPSTKKI